jgi:hypothetical protein
LISANSAAVRRIAFSMAVLVLFTSMVDLFFNRLLFRAGPEVLSHMNFDLGALAVVGRISFTFEQLSLFVILGVVAMLMSDSRNGLSRALGLLLLPQLVCGALLYFSLPIALQWGLTTILVSVTWIEIVGLAWLRLSGRPGDFGRHKIGEWAFFLSLVLAFSLPLYYRLSMVLGAVSGTSLPYALDAYAVGIYAIMLVSASSFGYALLFPIAESKIKCRYILVAALIPAILVGPLLYGIFSSFFVGQILSLVVAMSTDITLSFIQLRMIVFFWWFLLAAFFLMLFKGRGSKDGFLVQSAVGLAFILSTSFLFN